MKLVVRISLLIVFTIMLFRTLAAVIPSLQVPIVKDSADAITALRSDAGTMDTVVIWLA